MNHPHRDVTSTAAEPVQLLFVRALQPSLADMDDVMQETSKVSLAHG